MAFCTKCGKELAENANFCAACGKSTVENTGNAFNTDDFTEKLKGLNETKDSTGEYDAADIENNKILALFSYLAFLFVVPLIAAPNSKFARFHANQGLLLFICSAAFGIVSGILNFVLLTLRLGLLAQLFNLAGLPLLVLMIIGIVNAVNGKAKELPVIGGFKLI